jgi:hypothetical protein
VRHSAAFRVAPSLQTLTCMGAVAKDVDFTSETLCSRRRAARRRLRAWPVPFEPVDPTLADIDPVESETDFGDDDITIPDALSDATPSWAPADIGQALISEWETSADARAARPSDATPILRSSADNTAITRAAKLPIRSAS